eukprot:4899762-Alexandrium_andersonii.AAC.1
MAPEGSGQLQILRAPESSRELPGAPQSSGELRTAPGSPESSGEVRRGPESPAELGRAPENFGKLRS